MRVEEGTGEKSITGGTLCSSQVPTGGLGGTEGGIKAGSNSKAYQLQLLKTCCGSGQATVTMWVGGRRVGFRRAVANESIKYCTGLVRKVDRQQ
jgi:hypothetical protein